MRILFFNTYLGGGGAGRNMAYVINSFASPENDVELVLIYDYSNEYLSQLNDKVTVSILNKKSIFKSIIPLIKRIIKYRPEICYTGNYGLNLSMAPFIPILKLWGIKFIARETHVLSSIYNKSFIRRLFYYLFYNNYDAIIAQSEDMRNDLIQNWRISEKKIRLINNPVSVEKVQQAAQSFKVNDIPLETKYFVSVGRLVYQKGYDIILARMSRMPKENIFHLYIIGSGSQEQYLRDLARQYELENYVHFLGFRVNPFPYILRARGFILSSRHEGFPNVLLEANALGVPVFSNRCPGGINEIIVEGVNGISCDFEDQTEFLEAFDSFMRTEFSKERIITMTRDRYGDTNILNKYRVLFDEFSHDNSVYSNL